MADHDFDLFVIGGGSGGVRGARIAAQYGARVALAEERYLGGTCVNVGCIPKKLLVYASQFREHFADAAAYGWEVGETRFDWLRLIANKNKEIARLNGIYRRVLVDAGVEIMDAHARLLDAHRIDVGGRIVSAANILIATGSHPTLPKIPGVEHGISSNEAFFLPSLPRRIIIEGGGYIGCEFAGIFHGMGSEVVQTYRGALFLRGFDHDLRKGLDTATRKAGIDLRCKVEITRLDKAASGVVATLSDGERLECDVVMFATGRNANVQGLGLEAAGVELNQRGAIAVDPFMRTNQPHIFAIGDVTERVNLTPLAIVEGRAVAETLFNNNPTRIDHVDIPSAVFSQPEIATVGLTEEDARNRYGSISVFRTSFRPLKHTMTGRDVSVLMKLIVDKASDRVVGIHMLGDDAGEIIQALAVAVKAGATKHDFDRTIPLHPTSAEEFVTMRTPVPEPDRQAAE